MTLLEKHLKLDPKMLVCTSVMLDFQESWNVEGCSGLDSQPFTIEKKVQSCHVQRDLQNSRFDDSITRLSLPLHVSVRQTLSASNKKDRSLPAVQAGYVLVSVATTGVWGVCSYTSLATHATLSLPVIHNAICIVQALTPLPLLWGCCAALMSASEAGWTRMRSQTYRRLNLGLVGLGLWCALSVAFSPVSVPCHRRPRACGGLVVPTELKIPVCSLLSNALSLQHHDILH